MMMTWRMARLSVATVFTAAASVAGAGATTAAGSIAATTAGGVGLPLRQPADAPITSTGRITKGRKRIQPG